LVTLDREVTLEPGTSYALQVKLDDDRRDTVSVQGVAETTTTDTLTIADAWAYAAPEQYDLWQFGEVGKVSKSMRIVSITQAQDQKRKVTALEYVAEVYIDGADIPAPESPSALIGVSNLTANRYQGYVDGLLQQRVSLSWTGAAVGWNVFMRRSGGAWKWLRTVSEPSLNVTNLEVGWIYTFAVAPINQSIGAGKTVTVDFTMDAMSGDYQQVVDDTGGGAEPVVETVNGETQYVYEVAS
jgi:predicted phage tail protein